MSKKILPSIATILDPFSLHTISADAALLPLSLTEWKNQVAYLDPALLLVESAWWGMNRSWHGKISTAAPELKAVLDWCKVAGVPTVFWNKEDPTHFDRFLQTAALFDWVFTTDASVIPHYKVALGHSRVALLPFAAQPQIHHPVQAAPRERAACFAGSYYVRYPQRTAALQQMLAGLNRTLPIRIYDRYLGSTDANYRFPDEYQRWIVGTLKEDELPQAYKTHLLGINLNTVQTSETMCARRMFELLGSGTVVVSNPTPAVRKLFGDVVVMGDSAAQFEAAARDLLADSMAWSTRSMAGVRAVMRHHTIAHRLDKIYRLVLGGSYMPADAQVVALAHVVQAQDVANLVALLQCQTRKPDHLILLLAPQVDAPDARQLQEALGIPTHVVSGATWQHRTLEEFAQELLPVTADGAVRWWTHLQPGQQAQPVYFEDWMHATLYSPAVVVGYARVHQPQPGLPLASGHFLANNSVCAQLTLNEWVQGAWLQELDAQQQGVLLPVTEPWAYRENPPPFPELEAWADAQPAWMRPFSIVPHQDPSVLAEWFNPWSGKASSATLDEHGWFIVSELPDNETSTHWSPTYLRSVDLRAHGLWRFRIEMSGVLNLSMGLRCWDEDECHLLGEGFFQPNANLEFKLPTGTRKLQLGWSIIGSGSCRIKSLHLGWPRWSLTSDESL